MLTADPIAVSNASGLRSYRTALVGVLLLVVAGIALRGSFFEAQISRSPDEYTYTWQANLILQRGSAAFGLLGDQVLANPAALAIRPSPIRAAYLWLLASVMNTTGEHGPLAGAYISLVASCLNLCLVAFAAWRWLSPRAALIAALFGSTLPCDLIMARRAWQDAWIELLCDLVLVATLAMLTAHLHRVPTLLTAFGVLGLLCALTKENAALFFVLCAAILAARSILKREYQFALLVTAFSAAALIVAFAVLAVLFHGPANLIHVERVCLYFGSNGMYARQFESGSPLMFAHALALMSPVLACAAFVAALALIRQKFVLRGETKDVVVALAVLSVCMLAIQVGSGRYNLRFTAPVFGSLVLLASNLLDRASGVALKWMQPLGRSAAAGVICTALAVAALRDFHYGRDHLLQTDMQDLAVRPLLNAPPASLPNDYQQHLLEVR